MKCFPRLCTVYYTRKKPKNQTRWAVLTREILAKYFIYYMNIILQKPIIILKYFDVLHRLESGATSSIG